MFILTPAGLTYAAISAVHILLYTSPTDLGTYTTDTNGRVSQAVTIPADITPGYHTIEVHGTGQDGKPLTLWKIIEVRSQDDSDFDGDGVPNSSDNCEYIQPVGMDEDGDGIDDGCDPEIVKPKNSSNKELTVPSSSVDTSENINAGTVIKKNNIAEPTLARKDTNITNLDNQSVLGIETTAEIEIDNGKPDNNWWLWILVVSVIPTIGGILAIRHRLYEKIK